MKELLSVPLIYLVTFLFPACRPTPVPLSLHPDNPHYFLFRGEPMVLIGSTEHYGAVLNLDFDYVPYLDELASKGLNITRTFSGIYLEPQGAFGIAKNTLAPGPGKLICPWTRSNEPGYPGGGNKFDLTQWDEAYFTRLKDFITEAGKRNIVVELDLFSNFYDTLQWKLSPVYYANNINGLKPLLDQKEVLSLRHPEILIIQETMVRKIIAELNGFDNLYYEVCNEPYFGDLEALDAWEEHMTDVIAEAEEDLPNRHLISQNIQNGSLQVTNPHPAVSIFNFHYAKPPVTVEMNYALNRVIGDNETGFNGTEDIQYRTEAWDFLVAGGALYNNLDYSFTAEHENGSFTVAPGQPGGGGSMLREQLKILKQVFDELDFLSMKPQHTTLQGTYQGNATVRVLAQEGRQYLIYINCLQGNSGKTARQDTTFTICLELPPGDYTGVWIDPIAGKRTDFSFKGHTGGSLNLTTPPFKEDFALKIIR
jgi:hypothetical protein